MKIKFIPTGIVFDLPEKEVKRLLEEDRGNYEVVEDTKKAKAIVEEVDELINDDTPVDDGLIYNQIVEEDNLKEILEEKSRDELRKILSDLGCKWTITESKAKLIEKLEKISNDINISQYL